MAKEDLPWKERVCRNDSRKFMKYIQSTPTHGVIHIFTGKSRIRRLFWTVIVLAAAGSCLYNIVDRIQFFLSSPTSTTTTLVREESLKFPVVTICNLNMVRRSYLDNLRSAGIDIDPLIEFDHTICDLTECEGTSDIRDTNNELNLTEIILEGGSQAEGFILDCRFMGQSCNITESFTRVVTRLGVCYAFNSDSADIAVSSAPGPRFGLQLILNIDQREYTDTVNNDAGVTVVIHSQGEPGEPTDTGITVPPGHAARVRMTKRVVRDDSSVAVCRRPESADFNFLPDTYQYSISACIADSYFTEIARSCGCLDNSVLARPISEPFGGLSECSVSHLCCSLCVFATVSPSDCPSACHYTSYFTTTSYSAFPAEYTYDTELFSAATNTSKEQMRQDLISVSVFFQDFNIEKQTTRDVYEVTALLSDIGGQLGLFLGASVVSMLEFVLWVMDEVKDRCE